MKKKRGLQKNIEWARVAREGHRREMSKCSMDFARGMRHGPQTAIDPAYELRAQLEPYERAVKERSNQIERMRRKLQTLDREIEQVKSRMHLEANVCKTNR